MSLIERIKGAFRRDAPPGPGLRNRSEGLAWIKTYDSKSGADVLAGHVVRTVSLLHGNHWLIDPPQRFMVMGLACRCARTGRIAYPGTEVVVISMADDRLEPILDVGDDARDESLQYLPPVPTELPVKAHS